MKKGISLIVLVITIIVMIILAAGVLITLSNTSIINKASNAVDLTNESQVQDLAALLWADAYMDNKRDEVLVEKVKTKLEQYGIKEDNWKINITNEGITVLNKNIVRSLGAIITAKDYGKTINYEANGVTEWKVFYHNDDYVYIIASERVAYDKVPAVLYTVEGINITSRNLTFEDGTTKQVGQISWESAPTIMATIQNPTMWLANWSDYSKNGNGRCISYFLDETYWTAFKNTTANYAAYVNGVIGTPTAEMFIASWNAKREATKDFVTYNRKLALIANETHGYKIKDITVNDTDVTGEYGQAISNTDTLYFWSNTNSSSVWLASPSSGGQNNGSILYIDRAGQISNLEYNSVYMGVRPVVCLSANTPTKIGTTTDFAI